MSIVRPGLHQIDRSGATAGQVPVWDPASQTWKASNQSGITGLTSVDSSVTISDNGNGTLNLATAGGGGGSSFTNQITLALATLTGWTAGAGAWSITSSVIRQATTANGAYRLHCNTRVPLAECLIEVDVKFATTPNTASSRGGIVFGTPAAADGADGHMVALLSKGSTTQATAVDFEQDATRNFGQVNLAANITHGTWITFRVLKIGIHYDVYINGVYLTTYQMGVTTSGTPAATLGREYGRFALYSYASDVSFRNLRVWTPTLPT